MSASSATGLASISPKAEQLRTFCISRGLTLHLYGGKGYTATALVYLAEGTGRLQTEGVSQEGAASSMIDALSALGVSL